MDKFFSFWAFFGTNVPLLFNNVGTHTSYYFHLKKCHTQIIRTSSIVIGRNEDYSSMTCRYCLSSSNLIPATPEFICKIC